MSKTIHLGKIAGLKISAGRNVVLAFIILWLVLSLTGLLLLALPAVQAVLGGLLAVLLHYISELWHNLGHAVAARSTGYPMSGVRFWGPLGASIYPKDEPALPASIHIRRALGGPAASFLLALAFGGITLWVFPEESVLYWVSLFACLDNLLVLSLGAFLPLGFTDGSTLLYWGKKIKS